MHAHVYIITVRDGEVQASPPSVATSIVRWVMGVAPPIVNKRRHWVYSRRTHCTQVMSLNYGVTGWRPLLGGMLNRQTLRRLCRMPLQSPPPVQSMTQSRLVQQGR